jgi:hypothetical protein
VERSLRPFGVSLTFPTIMVFWELVKRTQKEPVYSRPSCYHSHALPVEEIP